MFNNLSEVIEEFILSNYTVEMASVYRDSLSLLSAFEYSTVYEKLSDVLFDPYAENGDLASLSFHEVVKESVFHVLKEHSVALFDEVELDKANRILSALLNLQVTEEFVPLLRIIESNQVSEETFAKIIDVSTNLGVGDIMQMVDSDNSNIEKSIEGIKLFLQERESETSDSETDTSDIRKGLEDYFHACGTDNIAHQLVSSGMLVGQSAAVYYPYVDEVLITDNDEQTAKNLVSFFLMASDTYSSPLESYRKYSESLIHDSARVSRIEEFIGREISKRLQYQTAMKETKSIQIKAQFVGETK